MATVLIIGAGAAGSVVAKKCALNRDVFTQIHLSSRALWRSARRCSASGFSHEISQVDPDDVPEVVALINRVKPQLVVNMALPYQDLPSWTPAPRRACAVGPAVPAEGRDKFCYKWQWDYEKRFTEKGILAVFSCRLQPGVTNIFCAHAQKHL